ncbi:MAG: hypothetical protein WCO78_01890 [Candidatus Roizmanbacteria bacterium]
MKNKQHSLTYGNESYLCCNGFSFLKIVIIVVVTIIAFAGSILFGIQIGMKESMSSQSATRSMNLSSSGSPPISPAPMNIYKIMVYSNKVEDLNPTEVANRVKEITGDESVRLYRDNLFDNKLNTNTLHVVTKSNVLIPTKKTDSQFTLTFVSKENEIMPYITSSKYCQTDNDCVSHDSFCQIGSYNQYHLWVVYGCGYATGVEGFTDAQIKQLTSSCKIYEGTGLPGFNADFTRSVCKSNQCIAEDMKVTCSN